jgi:outer membrane lipoprotein SlyB
MNATTTELTAGAPGAVATTAPSRMAWWIAGGLGLVGAGALAAALITQPAQTDDAPVKTLPAKTAAAKPANKPVTRTVAAVNANHGTVTSVTEQQQKGEGTGLGAVGGAVVGGVLGHQVGGGNGKKVMTVVGAVGGGLAGHEIEKRARATTVYNVQLTMDDGSKRTVTQSTAPAVGARFEVEGNQLRSLPAKG